MATPKGLKKIEAGLYEHPSGWLLVRTEGWGRNESQYRWEHARRERSGPLIVDSTFVYRTLHKAVADLPKEPPRVS